MEPLVLALANEEEKFVEVVERAVDSFERDVRVVTTPLDDVRADATIVLYDAPVHLSVGADALAQHARRSRIPIAVFTNAPSVDSAVECLRLGACGYLSKHTSTSQLGASLEHLMGGNVTVDPTLGGVLARTVARAPALAWSGMAEGLTRREGEILDLLRRGFTNREIAERFVIGMQTVKSHAHRIYAKLGATGRDQLRQ